MARPKPDTAEDASAAPKETEMPETPEQLAAAGTLAPPPPTPKPPTDQTAGKETHKPSPVHMLPPNPGGARKPNEHPDDPSHGEGHKAKYPGPDASRDEYLAYLRDYTNSYLMKLPPELFAGKRGGVILYVLVRPNGSIVWFSVGKPSGYPDADAAILRVLNQIPQFPPLPPELIEPDGKARPLTYSVPFDLFSTLR